MFWEFGGRLEFYIEISPNLLHRLAIVEEDGAKFLAGVQEGEGGEDAIGEWGGCVLKLFGYEIANRFECFPLQAAELRFRERLTKFHFGHKLFDVLPLFGQRFAVVFQDGGAIHACENGKFSRKGGYDIHRVAAAGECLDVEAEFRVHTTSSMFIEKDTTAVWIPPEIFVFIDSNREIVGIRFALPVEIGEAEAFFFLQSDMESAAASSAEEATVVLMLCNMDFIVGHGFPRLSFSKKTMEKENNINDVFRNINYINSKRLDK